MGSSPWPGDEISNSQKSATISLNYANLFDLDMYLIDIVEIIFSEVK